VANGFVSSFARGNSEGLLVGLVLWATERHLDGRRRDAFVLGAAAGLLRPEVWPFLAAYALWLLHAARRDGSRALAVILVAGAAVVTALLWFVPEYIGSGSLLRAATRARDPVPGSPGQADHPFLAVFENSASALIVPVYAGAVGAVVLAARDWRRHRRGGVALPVAALTSTYMLIVGVLAEAGFTGNLRYVTLPAAVVCVLAGAGWVRLVAWAREAGGRRAATAAAALAVLASLPWTVSAVADVGRDLDQVRTTAELSADLPKLIDEAGGRRAVQRCGRVFTGPLEVQLVAWHMRVPSERIDFRPRPPGVVLAAEGVDVTDDPRFRPVAASEHWTLRSTCG
jgi:hypothetical protein